VTEDEAYLEMVKAVERWSRYHMDQWEKFKFNVDGSPIFVDVSYYPKYPTQPGSEDNYSDAGALLEGAFIEGRESAELEERLTAARIEGGEIVKRRFIETLRERMEAELADSFDRGVNAMRKVAIQIASEKDEDGFQMWPDGLDLADEFRSAQIVAVPEGEELKHD
jgi:hypothetical protein